MLNHTKKMTRLQKSFLPAVLLLITVCFWIPAANAGITADHDIYPFLHRAWLYGATERPAPTVRPQSIPQLVERLREIDTNREQLPRDEQAELDELLNEFAIYQPELTLTTSASRWSKLLPDKTPLFANSAHMLSAREGDLSYSFDPIIAWQGIYDEDYNDEILLRSVIGVDVQATLGEYWSAGVRFTDTGEYNQNPDIGVYSPAPGKIASVSPTAASSSFDETRAYLEYQSKYVGLGIGRDRIEYGPYLNDGLLLSGEAPAYNYIQLQVRMNPWITFDYIHARLDPDPVEETVIYEAPTGFDRKVMSQKWFAAHRLEVNPTHWLQLGFAESVIYAERDVEVGYMIPLNLFWSENHHQDRDDNIAWGLDLRVQPVKGLAFQAEGLLDETSLSGMLTDKLHNRTAFSLGIDAIEPLGLRGSLLQLQLTRLRPYVYSHWFLVSVHTHKRAALGSSIPPNSEAITLRFEKRFGAVWKVSMLGQRLQHGDSPQNGDAVGGSVFELVPGASRDKIYPLLSGVKTTAWRGEAGVEWEPVENLALHCRVGLTRVESETLALFLAGFAYNL